MVRCPVLALLCCLPALPLLAAAPPHAAVTAEAGEESVEVGDSSKEQGGEHSQVKDKLQKSPYIIIIFLCYVDNVLIFLILVESKINKYCKNYICYFLLPIFLSRTRIFPDRC